MVENDLEGCGLEIVSQHRSAVVLLRFGNDLEGRRKRLPSKFFARLSHRTRDTLSLVAVAYQGETFCGAGGAPFRRTS